MVFRAQTDKSFRAATPFFLAEERGETVSNLGSNRASPGDFLFKRLNLEEGEGISSENLAGLSGRSQAMMRTKGQTGQELKRWPVALSSIWETAPNPRRIS